ncbi:glycosyltransferase family 2 protein [Cohnella sp. GbtcB17]|uniref:glycosyltransferase family 2 protein n=1 Tax=Cohnella sp. GbtcB17 TaxID=2824762 RepID=UPI001C2FA835|nr:glycosyltransferase family 2 protein [Cohnella sp. GbtcB17]
MSEPVVAVCIVTFNSDRYIENCLDHLSRQTWPAVRTVVIDNASADRTVELIRSHPYSVKLMVNERNNGFAGGQNQAIAAAEDAAYILTLNADVALEPDYISQLVKVLEGSPSIGSATGCLRLSDAPDRMDSGGIAVNWARRAWDRGAGEPVSDYTSAQDVFGVSGAAGLYARRMIEAISIEDQFFDEDFFAYKEDVDVAWRAGLLGWRSRYEPLAQAVHVRQWQSSASRKRMPLVVRRHSYINRYLMLIKNGRMQGLEWLKLPAHFFYEAALTVYFLIKDPRVLGGWVTMRQLIPNAFRKRRILKAMERQASSGLSVKR